MTKKILISQKSPVDLSQYKDLTEKYGVEVEFKPFFVIEPLSSIEFRSQKINILDYSAIIFSARHTIDAFFKLCDELRIKVPDTMKYFCSTEAVAMYLQKYIVYRKRKIFFGSGTPDSIISAIGTRHKEEKFLITTSDSSSSESMTSAFSAAKLSFNTAVIVKSTPQDLSGVDINSYDLIVFYNPADLKSLKANYPDFQAGNTKFITFGKHIVRAMEEAGLNIEIKAPTPEAPSVAKALDIYLNASNA